jgi:hypothetical protein
MDTPLSTIEMPRPTQEFSFGAPLQLTESPVEIRSKHAVTTDTLQSVNIRGQLLWEKHMKDIDLQRRYRKVSALMIHWEREGEDPFDAQDEVITKWTTNSLDVDEAYE